MTTLSPIDSALTTTNASITSYLENSNPENEALLWSAIHAQKTLLDDWARGRSYGRQYIAKMDEVKKTIRPQANRIRYYAVTVNPDTTKVPLSRFIAKCQDMEALRYVEDYVYTIEQRGNSEETMGQGYHTHMIIVSKMCPSDLMCNLKKRFKDCAIHIPPPQEHLEGYKKYWEYLKGNKSDEDKMIKVHYDHQWRASQSIPIKWGFSADTCVENPHDE